MEFDWCAAKLEITESVSDWTLIWGWRLCVVFGLVEAVGLSWEGSELFGLEGSSQLDWV